MNENLEQDAPRRRGPYQRSAETRERILKVALRSFGLQGPQGASAREIAAEAQVKLPAIAYYFGSKEGLYLACAEQIVCAHVEATKEASLAAWEKIEAGEAKPEVARALLSELLRALAAFYCSDENAPTVAMFVQREMAEPSAAFSILLDKLWRPGVEIAARLIAAIRAPNADISIARTDAICLISSIAFYGNGRRAVAHIIKPAEDSVAEELFKAVDRMVARI